MKNDEIANLKDSIENTIGNIPETMQAVHRYPILTLSLALMAQVHHML